VLRFINAVPYSLPETEHFHRGLRPYGAASRSSSSRDSAEPRRGAVTPPAHPLGVRPINFAYVTGITEGRTSFVQLPSS